MRPGSEAQARRARIEEIALQIAELSNELQELLVDDESTTTGTTTNQPTTTINNHTRPAQDIKNRFDPRAEFRVGDKIVITNNFCNFRGHTGTVTEVGIGSDEYIHFRQDSPSIITKRKPHNIRKLD